MNRLNKVLIGLMIVQIIAVIVIYQPNSKTVASGEPLIASFNPDVISQVKISDNADKEITLEKNVKGEWMLPDYDEYPVTDAKVTSLLDKIGSLQTGRLITHSSTSQRRLKVADDEFMRRIELTTTDGSGTTYTLYLGNAVGGNATHVRLGDEDQVFLVDDLHASDANTAITSWIDTTYFTAASDNIISATVENENGTFEFSKQGDNWTMTSPEAERDIDSSKISTFINQIATLRMQEPVSREVDDAWGMDTPALTVTIQVQEPADTSTTTPDAAATPDSEVTPEPPVITTYTYQLGTAQDNGYIAKSSESDYYVRVSTSAASTITGKTIDDFLVEPPPTPEATEEPANQGVSRDSTPTPEN